MRYIARKERIGVEIQILQVHKVCKLFWDGSREMVSTQVQMLQLRKTSKLRSYGAGDVCLVE